MRTCLSTEIFPAKRIFPKNNLGSNKPILTLPGKIRYDIITNYRVIRSIISTTRPDSRIPRPTDLFVPDKEF